MLLVRHHGEATGGAREKSTPLCEIVWKSKKEKGEGTAILTRVGIDNSLFGSRVTPATYSKAALAGRSCAGRTGIESISTVEYLNPNLLTTRSGNTFQSDDVEKQLASSPTRGPHRSASRWRLHAAVPTTATPDSSMPTLANVFPLFRKGPA